MMKEYIRLYESTEFNEYDNELFSDYYELNKRTYDKKRKFIKHNNQSAYDDDTGEKWRYVKKRDYNTLALAVIDGLCDRGILPGDMYKNIKSKRDLDEITMNCAVARRLINAVNNYLGTIIKRGHIRLYRGFNIPAEEYESWNLQERLSANLIKRFSNTGKLYNSYTMDIGVAESFATGNALGSRRIKGDSYGIIIGGDADLNDINFAYTAYLVGKHGVLNESEVNINCFKELTHQEIYMNSKIRYEHGRYIY